MWLNALGLDYEIDVSKLPASSSPTDIGAIQTSVHITSNSNFKNRFLQANPDTINIFSDSSKRRHQSACALVCLSSDEKLIAQPVELRFPNGTPVFDAELQGLNQAMQLILTNQWNKTIVYSDSQAALVSLSSAKSLARSTFVKRIHQTYCRLKNAKCEVQFVWVPGHRRVTGNELADAAAKRALETFF